MSFDQAKAEQFADRFVGALNEGALCLMSSIGHRTGLFDVMRTMQPATSEQIAAEAGLNERYVREWLGAMTTSGVIEAQADTGHYFLPKEHAAFLTRAASPENIAVYAQYIPLLGTVEDDIVRCFKEGGGVPYERYTRFHTVMAEDSGQTVLSSLMEHILPLIDGIQERLEQGIRVLDVGCGIGRAVNLLAKHYPNSQFVGLDLSVEAIATAKHEAREMGLSNVKFVAKDLTHFDDEAEPHTFDFVTSFDAVHDQAKPLSLLKGIYKTLKNDGVYLMQDIHSKGHAHANLDHPVGTLLYTVSCMHCMTVSLAQGGEGLGAMWGREKAAVLLRQAGFKQIDIHQLEHDFQNDYFVIRK
jgi:2-polyprenyl-3-methyl-5-hydroxy-6-metoxy-1,4-benzoquinol methylase